MGWFSTNNKLIKININNNNNKNINGINVALLALVSYTHSSPKCVLLVICYELSYA